MGQHIPVTPTPMEIPNRVEDFPHIDLARALLAGAAWQGGAAVPPGCSSVRSDGYLFRDWYFFNITAHSSAHRICANSLISLVFCQARFPDSL